MDTGNEPNLNITLLCPREEIVFPLNNSNLTDIVPIPKTKFEEVWDRSIQYCAVIFGNYNVPFAEL